MTSPWLERRRAGAGRERVFREVHTTDGDRDREGHAARLWAADAPWSDPAAPIAPLPRADINAPLRAEPPVVIQPMSWLMRERRFALWLHGAATRLWARRLFEAVSRAGDGWIWYVTIVALPWLDHQTGAAAAVRMVAVGLIDLMLYKIIKRAFARPRPYRAWVQFRPVVKPLDEFSFPSGHTMHAVAFSVILTAYHPHLATLVWPFTAMLATSRVVLGLHYPSDVVVGAALGAVTAWISFNAM